MDPNTNLDTQLRLARQLLARESTPEDAADLAEHMLALHEWITSGGFLPKTWQEGRPDKGAKLKVWAVYISTMAELCNTLNHAAAEGYQVSQIKQVEPNLWCVIGFDPVQLMARQQQAMQAQFQAQMAQANLLGIVPGR
jgi:hypothetical protein